VNKPMNTIETDVAVIGAGPIGLFSVFALGQVGLKAVVVDALQDVGGQCTALYPEKPIYDIPSRSSISGSALVDELLNQAKPYEPTYRLGQQVRGISTAGGRFELELSNHSRLRVGAVFIAAGGGAFGPNKPPLEDIDRYEGHSVFYAVRSPDRFRGMHVAIAGGGDSAADWAVHLSQIARSVTIIHRRASFRAAASTVSAIEKGIAEGRIAVLAPGTLAGLEGVDQQLNTVLVHREGLQPFRLHADALLCFFGLAKDLSALEGWDIDASRMGIPVSPENCQTRRAGIFAIGDIALYPGKLKLILTGFAEAASAAHAARQHIKPNQAFHFEYSTTKGVPA
jgi:thioredoxin reductase (NADPH)